MPPSFYDTTKKRRGGRPRTASAALDAMLALVPLEHLRLRAFNVQDLSTEAEAGVAHESVMIDLDLALADVAGLDPIRLQD